MPFYFLIQAKQLVNKDNGFIFINREKCLKYLIENNLTIKDVKETILNLTCADYIKGPEIDRDEPGSVWIFKKECNNKIIYIKLKIENNLNETKLKCLSIHEDNK